jgi:hypothetical protein
MGGAVDDALNRAQPNPRAGKIFGATFQKVILGDIIFDKPSRYP